MPWIKVIEENEAEGEVKEIYDSIKKSRRKLSNIMQIQSLMPEVMKSHMDLYLSVMFNKSSITRDEKELIAVVVSTLNDCLYCINHHAEALNSYWKDPAKIQQVINDYKTVELPVRSFAILSYAEKLTLNPGSVNEHDLENLQIHGMTDEDILNINLIVSYFNFVNRIANGLGVEFSDEEVKGYAY